MGVVYPSDPTAARFRSASNYCDILVKVALNMGHEQRNLQIRRLYLADLLSWNGRKLQHRCRPVNDPDSAWICFCAFYHGVLGL